MSRAALLALLLGCTGARPMRVRPVATRDLTGVVFMPFASSRAEGLFDPHGRPCGPYDGTIVDFFAGWQSHDPDPICDHDTFDDGMHPASLELRWHGAVPGDGAFDLVSGGYAVGAFGRVVARGSNFGDYVAWARIDVEARSPHCHALWSSELAKAKLTGIYARQAEFTGWWEVPDTRMTGCKAGDPLDIVVRFAADSNRGKIEVDAFGFSAVARDDLNHMFGVRAAAAAAR
jgi:hypothetical protein